MNKHLFLFFILFLIIPAVRSQESLSYDLVFGGEGMQGIDEKRMERLFRSARNGHDLDRFMYHFYESGYLLAGYKTDTSGEGVVRVYIDPGEPYKWATLEQGNLPDEIFIRTGLKRNVFTDRIFNFNRITRLFRAVVRYAENNGYPFASVRLGNVEIDDNRIGASIVYDPGPHVVFGEVVIPEAINLKPSFLAGFLQIMPGAAYDQRKMRQIDRRIKSLEFVELPGHPSVLFRHDSGSVHLDLLPVRANTFDGIIGFMPNENEPDKLLVTGQLMLGLNNLFRTGKKLVFEWQKPNILMQELKAVYGHPALFRSPLDLDLSFFLFKQDTSFINRDLQIGFSMETFRAGNLGISYHYSSSRLLGTEVSPPDQLPDEMDYDINYYGIRYRLNTLNRNYFPEKGFLIEASAELGTKRIIGNAGLNDDLFDSLEEKTFQIRTEFRIERYFLISPRNTLMARLAAGLIHNDQLFYNDLFRPGGLRSIRGFNEKFFYASRYLTGTLEYRYLFENDSQVFLFVDGSGLGYDLNNMSYSDHPVGFGAGFSLSTRAGLLEIIYALGRSNGQPVALEHSKIHIGYSSRF